MQPSQKCAQCEAEIPAGAPGGLCPGCLLKLGFASQSSPPGHSPSVLPTYVTPPGPTGFVPPAPADLARIFPQFEVLDLLGKGGMGAVYKARQISLDRMVVIKILAPGISGDPAFVER